MGILDKLLLTIYTLALAFISGLMLLVAVFPAQLQPDVWIKEVLEGGAGNRFLLGFVSSLFFAVSVRLILSAFARKGGGQPVVHETTLGDVRISLDAVENLVRKVARSIKGVREIKAVVSHGKDGLHVHLKGTISPEVSIPDVSEEIQSEVRSYVKRVVGVELAEVRLAVENIANDGRRGRLD